jgi:hypothetical protein
MKFVAAINGRKQLCVRKPEKYCTVVTYYYRVIEEKVGECRSLEQEWLRRMTYRNSGKGRNVNSLRKYLATNFSGKNYYSIKPYT